MSTVKAEGRLLVLQGLLILCQTDALFCAGVALAVGVVAAAVGIGVGSGALALPGLFCLAALAAVAVFACRGLIALHRLIHQLAVGSNPMPALMQLDRIAHNAALTGCAWTLLVTVLAICGWEGAATPVAFARFMLPAPCLWLMSLGSHTPAASIRQRLPYTGASPLPLPVARCLLALCAGLTAAAGCMTRPEGWLLPACMAFTSALLLIVLWAWQRKPRLLRIAGWCLILCGAGLLLREAGNRMAGGTRLRLSVSSLTPLLPALAMICFPAAAGMSLLLHPNLIFPVR